MSEATEILKNLEKKIRDTLKDCHGCGVCSLAGSHIPFREGGLVPEHGTPTPKCPPATKYKILFPVPSRSGQKYFPGGVR